MRQHVLGQTVKFICYRKGELWYETSSGLAFSVPISDTGDETFLASDKASFFMRWIRAAVEPVR